MSRTANIERTTSETDISVKLNVDGTGESKIDTGVGFFDHMLTLFAKHGLFDLEISAKGDLRSTAITRSRTSASAWGRHSTRLWAPRRASPATVFSSCRWTRRWRQWPWI